MNTELHFSSKDIEWSTPQDLYDSLNLTYRFTLDPCATKENAKCDKYYTKEDDGLIKDWSKDIVFMNPPYGREIKFWIKKAYEESLRGATVVCLIPARTDTLYWHNYILNNKADDIIFVKGRLKFGNNKNPAPFPSAIIVYKSKI